MPRLCWLCYMRPKLILRSYSNAFVQRLHLLLVSAFDFMGGPKFCQFFIHLISHTSPLTPEEIAILSSIFGANGMRYQDVRIAEGGLLAWVFRVNGRLAFTTWYTINLPQPIPGQTKEHSRANLSLLVHECAHVYQFEKVGSRYLTEAIYILIKTRRNCYQYGGPSGLKQAHQQKKSYAGFNREQQAQIVQDYYTRREQGKDTSLYEPFIRQLRQGIL